MTKEAIERANECIYKYSCQFRNKDKKKITLNIIR